MRPAAAALCHNGRLLYLRQLGGLAFPSEFQQFTMPMYEYECLSCRERFEIIQKFSDEPASKCPSCGGAVRKLLSAPAIQFKGSGWYVTDYAKSGQESKKSAEAKTESKADSKSDSKSESKDSKKESTSSSETSTKQTAKAGKD
jgi:putative FmdB family regulatory protein